MEPWQPFVFSVYPEVGVVGPLQGPEAYGTTRSIGLWFSKLERRSTSIQDLTPRQPPTSTYLPSMVVRSGFSSFLTASTTSSSATAGGNSTATSSSNTNPSSPSQTNQPKSEGPNSDAAASTCPLTPSQIGAIAGGTAGGTLLGIVGTLLALSVSRRTQRDPHPDPESNPASSPPSHEKLGLEAMPPLRLHLPTSSVGGGYFAGLRSTLAGACGSGSRGCSSNRGGDRMG